MITFRSKRREGSAAVEFALVGPIFVLLLVGMVVYGGWYWLAQTVQHLAVEGARAAVAGLDPTERETLARQAVRAGMADGPGLRPDRMQVTVAADGQTVSVRLRYDASDHPVMALAGLTPTPPPGIVRTAHVRMGGH